MIKLDINTTAIPSNGGIWVLHPGRKQIFDKEFRQKDVVFLDFPKLYLNKEDEFQTPLLRQKIQRAEAWRKYIIDRAKALKAETDPPEIPSDLLNDYMGDRSSKALNNSRTNVVNLYFTAKVGDLILVPTGQGQFGKIYFAELTSEFDPTDIVNVGGDIDYPVASRRVKWLSPKPQKRDVDEALAKRLENRRALISLGRSRFGQLDRSTFGKRVYSLAYTNFTMHHHSKSTLFGPTYSSTNARDIIEAIDVTSWLVAAFEAISDDQAIAIRTLTPAELIEKFYPRNLVEDFKIRFTSAGELTLVFRKAALGVFVAGGLPLLLLIADTPDGDRKMEVINSQAKGHVDKGQSEGIAALHGLMQALQPARQHKILKLAKEAKAHVGLRSGATIEVTQEGEPRQRTRQ